MLGAALGVVKILDSKHQRLIGNESTNHYALNSSLIRENT